MSNQFGMDYQGGGGNGFAPSNGFGGSPQAGGGGTQDSSQKQRPKRNYDEQTIIPVTFAMIMNAQDESGNGGGGGGDATLMLDDGRPLHTVKVVAAVRSAEDQSTNVMYVLEDGTACMDVKQWLDDNDPSAVSELRQQTARDGVYVKVIGQVKHYEGRRQIIANSIRPISSGNELTHHILEVVYSSEKYKRDNSIVAPNMAMMSSNNNMSSGQALSIGGNTMMGNVAGGGAGAGGIDAVMNKVGAIFQQHSHVEEGIPVTDIIQYLPDISEADIRQAILRMSEDGTIYSTISDDHYRLP